MSTTVPASATTGPDPDLDPGQQVGEYVVESKLGQGGFGAVFKATHPLIGKVVALKVLARRFSVDPEMVERFVAEARAVNQIRHRNIIDIFSFGQLADGRHYYAMEYLDGEPLDAILDRGGAMPLGEALPILRAIARALDACHAKGIAHRDLKPANIFVAKDPDGALYPKLLDFGIAKLMSPDDPMKNKTRTGIPMGTPYYMSPEQCRGRDVDHRTDYYAFGIVAYELLTGKVPISGDDYMEILMKQISTTPEPPSSVIASLPEGVDDGVMWLMKKDPAERPPNLVAAVAALEEAAQASGVTLPAMRDSKPIAAVRSNTPTPGKLAAPITMSPAEGEVRAELARRSKLLLILAAAGLAAIVAIVAIVMTRSPKGGTVAGGGGAVAGAGGEGTTGLGANRSGGGSVGNGTVGGGIGASGANWAGGPVGDGSNGVVGGNDGAGGSNGSHSVVGGNDGGAGGSGGGTVGGGNDGGGSNGNGVGGGSNGSGTGSSGAAAFVTLTLAGVPDGTEVLLRGNLVGITPAPIQIDRGSTAVTLVIKAPGHQPGSLTVTPDRDLAQTPKLKKLGTSPKQLPKQPNKDDIAIPKFD